jgi:hypothetical protein
MSVDDAKLIAFADGELSGAERAEVEQALSEDAHLRERLAAHERLRARLSAAFDGVLDEPVPERLLAAAAERRAAEVVDLSERRATRWSMREWSAMAASLAAGVLIGYGALSARAPMIAVTGDGMSARGALAQALETHLASDEAGAVRIGLTFRAHDGAYCRTFELTRAQTAGLACRGDEGWDVAMTAALESGGEVRMAAAPAEILAAVDAMIADEPLDAQDEARARDARWRAD